MLTILLGLAVGIALTVAGAAVWRLRAQRDFRWLAKLLSHVHDAVIVWRLDGVIIYWNRGAAELYGWSERDALGHSIHEFLGTEPAGPDDIWAVERQLLTRGEWAGDLRQRTGDGRALRVQSRMVIVRGARGVKVVLEANHDITAREAADRARRIGEARLRAVVETAADAIVTMDAHGRVESWNPAAERLFGFRADEVIGQNVSMIMPEPDRSRHAGYLERYRRTRERHIIGLGREVLAQRKDGTVFPVDLAVGEADVDHVFYTGILRDVSDRKRAEAEREMLLASERAARNEAERATRMKEEFLSTISHELRTPLNAIVGWTGILESCAGDPETTRRAIEIIRRNVTAQTELVEDLLDMGRIIAGKLRLDPRPTALADVIEAATAAVQPAMEAKQITLERRVGRFVPDVLGDAGRLQQVTWNLLSNAVKFTARGGHVRVSLRATAEGAEIAVTDSGQGISAELLPHVFERFRQGDASTTRSHRGLGLGLALVKYIVEAHGGSVYAESGGADRGATFTVRLPAMSAQGGGVDPALREDRRALLDGIKVLVVDDEEDAREMVSRVLAERCAEVQTAASAREALVKLQRERPDVLLSDIGLPGEDGYELIRSVRTLGADAGGDTPAAAVTALARPEDRERALREGFQVHIAKPIEVSALVRAVAALGRSRAG